MILLERDLIKNPDIDRAKEYILCHHVLYNWNSDLVCDFFYICENREVVSKLQQVFKVHNELWVALREQIGDDVDRLTDNEFEMCFIRWYDDGWADDCSHSSNIRFAGSLDIPRIVGYINPSKSGFRGLSDLITKDRMGYMFSMVESSINYIKAKLNELNRQ